MMRPQMGARRSAFSLLVFLSAVACAHGAVVRRADESMVKGDVRAIRDGALVVADGDAEVLIPLADLAEVSFDDQKPPIKTTQPTTKPGGKVASSGAATQPTTKPTKASAWRVTLHNSDQLTLNVKTWSQGLLSGSLGNADLPFDMPLSGVREIWLGPPDRVKAAKALNEPAGAEDIAYAARDTQVIAVRGVALGLNEAGDALKFKFGNDVRSIALSRLIGLVLAQDTSVTPANRQLQQVVSLASGDTLSGTWTSADENAIGFTTPWGLAINLPRREVTRITTRNGRITSLSDLTPSKVEQTPYMDRVIGWQIDRSLDGKPLMLSDGACSRGLSVHSRCVLTYDLSEGDFGTFKSKVGFQQPEGKLGQAVVRVLGDGKVLFENADARGDKPPVEVTVKLDGVRQLVLEVDFGEGQDVGDRVVWGNARLIRSTSR